MSHPIGGTGSSAARRVCRRPRGPSRGCVDACLLPRRPLRPAVHLASSNVTDGVSRVRPVGAATARRGDDDLLRRRAARQRTSGRTVPDPLADAGFLDCGMGLRTRGAVLGHGHLRRRGVGCGGVRVPDLARSSARARAVTSNDRGNGALAKLERGAKQCCAEGSSATEPGRTSSCGRSSPTNGAAAVALCPTAWRPRNAGSKAVMAASNRCSVRYPDPDTVPRIRAIVRSSSPAPESRVPRRSTSTPTRTARRRRRVVSKGLWKGSSGE